MKDSLKSLINEEIKNMLAESTHSKDQLQYVLKHGHHIGNEDHYQLHDLNRPFDDKFQGDTDEVADKHNMESQGHTIRHLIAKHVGDKVGAKIHALAAKAHAEAAEHIGGGYHEDSDSDWNEAQHKHEFAIKASKMANDHDK